MPSKILPTLILLPTLLTACSTMPDKAIPTVDYVDVDRFMGDWYVIANIPTFIETEAHNAVESYKRVDETTIATTFSFNEGSFDGKRQVYTPTGYIEDTTTNATWGMQFFWPVISEYRIVYLDEKYTQTIIGRSKRDYVWIMARTPQLSDSELQKLIDVAVKLGYQSEKIQRVPQDWANTNIKTVEATNE